MEPGIGPSSELSLRVSAATLASVTFPHPDDGTQLLALEHKATAQFDGDESRVSVRVQPFGGAVRIMKPQELQEIVDDFNYDSERSRSERDFRIFINPTRWEAMLDFCQSKVQPGPDAAIDADPTRELEEEFVDSLGIHIQPQQYSLKRIGWVIEQEPRPTNSMRAPGHPTARLYWVDKVEIQDQSLCTSILNVRSPTTQLRQEALKDLAEGGRGHANSVFTVPLERIRAAYLALSPEERNEPLHYEGVLLGSNLPAVLEGVDTPKFKKRSQGIRDSALGD